MVPLCHHSASTSERTANTTASTATGNCRRTIRAAPEMAASRASTQTTGSRYGGVEAVSGTSDPVTFTAITARPRATSIGQSAETKDRSCCGAFRWGFSGGVQPVMRASDRPSSLSTSSPCRSAPSMRRRSSMLARAPASIRASTTPAAVASGCPAACTATTANWLVTVSCRSRATRSRSASTARSVATALVRAM